MLGKCFLIVEYARNTIEKSRIERIGKRKLKKRKKEFSILNFKLKIQDFIKNSLTVGNKKVCP